MARYIGPSTRISRRFGQFIIGSGKAFERRNFPPGQHGPKSRRKMSEYAVGLNEKQKARYIYGLLERQFRRVFAMAKRERGITGERFLQLLETRLDSVIYHLGFTKTRAAARQFVNHGHVRVNGRKVDISSFNVKPGDEVEVKPAASSRQIATRLQIADAAAGTIAGDGVRRRNYVAFQSPSHRPVKDATLPRVPISVLSA